MGGKLLKRTYLVLFFSFLYLPIIVLIAYSFNASKSRTVWAGFTLDWYRQLFRDEVILSALGLSVAIAFVSAIIATIIGTLAAIGIISFHKAARRVIMNVSYLPVINPEIITGVSLMLLFVVMKSGLAALDNGAGGVWGWLSERLIGLPSLLIAHITFNVPYVLFNVTPKLKQMDIHLYEAALDLGCNERQAFFKVVLPEIMPAVFSSFLICLTYSIDDFTISYFTSGTKQTLPIAIYSMTRRRVSPEINALSAILFVVILLIIISANLYDTSKNKHKRKKKAVVIHPI